MRPLILLCSFFLFLTPHSKAADFYWIGGTGTWNDVNHWSNTNGGTSVGIVPGNTDDVFFTPLSGLVTGSTITFPTLATSTCRNLTFMTGVTGINIRGAATARFDLNGSATLEPGMNFGTGAANTAALAWLGRWYFYQSTAGSVNTFTTGNNTLYNSLIRFELPSSGTGNDFQVHGNFVMTQAANNELHFNLQSATQRVYFNNSCIWARGVQVFVGQVHTLQGYHQPEQTSAPHFTDVSNLGSIYNYGPVTGGRLLIDGRVYFNAGNTGSGNVINYAQVGEGGSTVASPFLLDFNNCMVNISSNFTFGGHASTSNTANRTLNASGSTLRFRATANLMRHTGHTYNNIIVEDNVNGNAVFTFTVFGTNTTHNPTIDSLTINKNVVFNHSTSSGTNRASNYLITGLFQLAPGISCDGIIGRNEFRMTTGATLYMVGDCDNPIFLTNTTHEMTGVGLIAVDHLIMDQTVRAIPGPSYFSGANSIAITGANIIGWTSAARTPRTLVWIGGCNLPPVITLPSATVSNSNAVNTGLSFTPSVNFLLNSVDVYASNSTAAAVNIAFRIINNGTGGILNTITVSIPAAASNLLITLPFATNLTAGVSYRIQRVTNSASISLRINTAATFPVNIVANDSRCLVGQILGGLPVAGNYYNFFNWNTSYIDINSLSWYNSLNWCDVTGNPTWNTDPQVAPYNPGYCGSVCPPTEIDSVIFPNNSYVYTDESTMYCEGMNWLGTGRLIGNANQDMEVWASLYLSPQMLNNFGGTFRFRSNRTYVCNITTSNKLFMYGVLFNSEGGNGKWLLMDTLKTINVDPECNLSNTEASFRMNSGHLRTGTIFCTPGNGQTIQAFGMTQTGGELSLYDSDIYVFGAVNASNTTNNFNFHFGVGGILNAGTSHFIFENTTANSTFGGTGAIYPKIVLGSKIYYDITLKKPSINTPTNYSHILSLAAGFIHKLTLEANTWPIIQAGSAIAGQIQLLESHTTMDVSFGQGSTSVGAGSGVASIPYVLDNTRLMVFDTVMQLVANSLYLGIRTQINSVLNVVPGTTINFATGTTCDISAATSYTSPFLPTCPGGGTVNYPGGLLRIDGSCLSGNVTINGGSFIANTPLVINAQYLTINNNTIIGPNAPFNTANSLLTGTTTGWNGVVSFPRKLRWRNISSIAANLGNFQDANNWEQVFPTALPAPQCPPTQVDTVLFDNTSFSANGQQVELTGLTDVASMYWENIPAGQNPVLVGTTIQTLTIRCNLFFHPNMLNNHLGEVVFRGSPGIVDPFFYIRSSGKQFGNDVYFNADHDATEWHLLDNFSQASLNNFVYLNRGRLVTDGHNMRMGRFYSLGASARHLDIRNSTITLRYSGSGVSTTSAPEWNIAGTPLVNGRVTSFTLNAVPSKIECSAGQRDELIFGGHKYDTIISNSTGRMALLPNVFRRDSINTFLAYGTTLNSTSIQIDSIWIRKAELFKPTTIMSDGGHYDSLFFRANASMTSSNKIHKLLHFEPGSNYTLTGGTVQWVQNAAVVELNGGSAAGTIQFYGNPTGSTAFIRKDSAYFCADYVNIRDVWAIGNGNNPSNSCFGGTINNNCPHANPWVVSSCDTVTYSPDICGPWTPAVPNRGRADFNAGAFADLQGGNVFGWDKRPYPDDPELSAITPDKLICFGQQDTVTFTFVEVQEPILFQYDSSGVTINAVLTSPGAGYGSEDLTGSGTAADPYVWNMIFTMNFSPTTFAPLNAVVERCLGGNSPIIAGLTTFTADCLLSVELRNFNAQKQEKKAFLTWQTASEKNNDYFEVQRSANGMEFYPIGQVPGYGNSSSIQSYQLIDPVPMAGNNYYRLKQVDEDGSYQFSELKVLYFEEANIGIYPNPANDWIMVVNPFETAELRILDITGKLLLTTLVSEGNQTIDISNLAAGVYVVETKAAHSTKANRFKLTVLGNNKP